MRLSSKIFMTGVLCGFSATLTPVAHAQTTSGSLAHNETWSDTVIVTGDIRVPEGVTLTIEPGAVVLMTAKSDDQRAGGAGMFVSWPFPRADDSMRIQFMVYGTLNAVGTPDQLIVFTSDSPEPEPYDWVGVQVEGSADIRHCIFEYAQIISFGSSTVDVSHSVFRHLQHSVSFFGDGCTPTFSHNYVYDGHQEVNIRNASPTFTHNILRIDLGVEFDSQAIIEHNVFEAGSVASGVWVHSIYRYNLILNNRPDWRASERFDGSGWSTTPTVGVLVGGADPIIKWNSIFRSAENARIVAGAGQGTGPVDISENWWGTTDLTEIRAGISTFTERPIALEPILDAPHPDIPLPPPMGLTGAAGYDDVTLSWTMADFRKIAGYKIHYDTDSEFPYRGQGAAAGLSPIDAGIETTYTVSGLAPDRTYYFTVSAYDSSGRESWISGEEIRRTTNQPAGNLRGLVKDALTLQPIANATVIVDGGHVATTGQSGRYFIEDISPGTHVPRAEAEHYHSAESDGVIVTAGAESTADFMLDLHVDDGLFETVVSPSGGNIYAATVDESGDVWIGTGGGLTVFDGSKLSDVLEVEYNLESLQRYWSHITMEQGLAENVIGSICLGDAGKVWLGHRDFDGVSFFDGDEWRVLGVEDGLSGDNAYGIAVDLAGDIWIGFCPGGISRFDGSQWTTENETSAYCVVVDDQNHKWFGTSAGIIRFDGSHWTTHTPLTFPRRQGPPDVALTQCLYVDRANNIWGGTNGYGVVKFDRVNQQWTTYDTSDGLADGSVLSIVQDRQGNMWFATAYNGLSKFDGSRWTNYSVTDGLPLHVVTALAVDHGGNLWIGTWNGIALFLPYHHVATGIADEHAPPLPSRYSLSQNYPNPFNPTTTINYSLPAAGRVQLAVHDLLGQRVATLLDRYQSVGDHEMKWNASGLGSGVYFYRITAGEYSDVRKCVVLK